MTRKQEDDLVKTLEKLMDDMNHPTPRNQIRNERLQYMIALLLAASHNAYWNEVMMDEPSSDDAYDEAAFALSDAFSLIDGIAVRANIDVMKAKKKA